MEKVPSLSSSAPRKWRSETISSVDGGGVGVGPGFGSGPGAGSGEGEVSSEHPKNIIPRRTQERILKTRWR